MTPKFCVKHFISFTLCFSMFLKENNGFSKSLEIYILSLLLEECKLCINYCLITWKRRLVSSSVINSSLLAILSSHKLSSILYSNKLYCLIYKYNLKSAGSKPFIFLTMAVWSSRSHSLKYHWSMTLSCKDTEIRNSGDQS